MTESADSRAKTSNFNVGVLGHVDSGKTSSARASSSTASTAAFDKNPQSRERGITSDLGFSSFTVDFPDHSRDTGGQRGFDSLQFTSVDCPGHASSIRTIIGGAQIIDSMMSVVDVVKGVQTQTAECLSIGESTCPRMVVVSNKIDSSPPNKRQGAIEKMTKRLHKTSESTRFKECPVIAVAAKPGGPEAPETEEPQGVPELIELLKKQTYLPKRDPKGDLLMAVDHCFSIRGQGTVMTGTILQGSSAINDTVEIPVLKVTKKIKSVQMFRKPVSGAMQGDRVGVCVTQFDPKSLERGLVCTPGSSHTLYAAVISTKKIGYFKGSLATRAKFHITVGHETVMAKVTFFGSPPDTTPTPSEPSSSESPFSFDREYFYQDEYVSRQKEGASGPDPEQWALLEFERPVTCPALCSVIGSKSDTDIHANACRSAFQGRLSHGFEDKSYAETASPRSRIYKTKHKEGQVERVTDDYSVIGRSLFKKETNSQLFVGSKVTSSTGESGVIEGGFGQSGKFKIRIPDGLRPETKQLLSSTSKKKGKSGGKGGPASEEEPKAESQPVGIHSHFKRYVFDPHKKMVQS